MFLRVGLPRCSANLTLPELTNSVAIGSIAKMSSLNLGSLKLYQQIDANFRAIVLTKAVCLHSFHKHSYYLRRDSRS